HLIIFSRYPEPGKTKTRLIPALGAQGAANLQRQMTEYTLSQVRAIKNTLDISIEICFAGGNQQLMQDWLGSDLIYQEQGEGDLGCRMARSLALAFRNHAQQVVIIGTDCPSINTETIIQAFEQLQLNHDLVLGPAVDGGYYLIGLRRPIPELFININWGTAQVLSQTVNIAQRLQLSVAYLPEMADIDRPEDIPLWEQIRQEKVKKGG
ncbi:MAG: TIGR04282 family arsenosugar biosynthesis glycosyltransferase, partial [Nostocaceae cyanobacterium]|nr:TIGR04282 family arsenosugar biosynthesis glycosyltransferase [Nostocaceae cyanobacterium]